MKSTLLTVGLFICLFLSQTAQAAESGPNILFLLLDDQRQDSLGIYGNKQIATPNIDALAKRGMVFTQAHIMGGMHGAICVPSRATLMSGRTLFRVTDSLKDADTWPNRFAAAGYNTFITGKWHNGRESLARIFSTGRNIFLGGMTDQFAVKVIDLEKSKISNDRTEKQFSATLFSDSAIGFLNEQDNSKPFCLYVAFTTPHDPRSSPIEFQKRYSPEKMRLPPNFTPEHPFDNGELMVRDEKLIPHPRNPDQTRKEIADYYATISATDFEIGRILGALKKLGLEESTVIVVAGDNGLAMGSHGLLGKQSLYEHSMKVPLLVAGPGIKKGARSKSLCYLLDLAPTLCSLARISPPQNSEGIDLSPVLRGETDKVRPAIFTAYRDVQRAYFDGRWKLIEYPKIGKTQLFDLRSDPHEKRDLADKSAHQKNVSELRTRLASAQLNFHDPLLNRPSAQ